MSAVFLRYRPRVPLTETIFKTIGVDFVINNRDSYKIGSDNFFDFTWSFAQDKFLLYLTSCSDSPWAFRQIGSAYLHAQRLGFDTCLSCCDLAISNFVGFVFPRISVLNGEAAKKRSIRRILGTMRRNGGVYKELADIIKNFAMVARLSPTLSDLVETVNSYPCSDPPKGNKEVEVAHDNQQELKSSYTVENVKDQFEYETGIKFFSVFSAVDRYPIEVGDLIIHNASLTTGERVSITVMKRSTQRMRKFDLIPFHIINLLLKPIPFISLEKGMYQSIINRLTFSLGKEKEARAQLLEKFGVDFTKAPTTIFNSARRIPLDVYIPAPLLHLCSNNVMVTDLAPSSFDKLSKSDARHIVNFTSDLLYNQSCIIPDLSPHNLRKWKNKISLSRFASLTPVDNDKFSALLTVFYSMQMRNQKKAISAAEALGINSEPVVKMVTTQTPNLKVVRKALKENSSILFPVAEASAGMLNNIIDSGASYFTLEPFVVGAFAKIQNKYKSHTSFPYNMLKWAQYIPSSVL